MLYSELLKQQEHEASRLNFEYRESRDQIKRMQQEHFDPNKFKDDLQRLDAAFKRDCDALNKRHQQEKKEFLNEPEKVQDKPRQRDMDNAYNKSVTYTVDGLKKTDGLTVEQKMQKWDEEQREKTQQRERAKER